MADRKVTQSRKDSDGDITALCNPGQGWSPRTKSNAISDIENGYHTYYVQQPGTNRADIHVFPVGGRKHLRTDPDASTSNNLDNLPDC